MGKEQAIAIFRAAVAAVQPETLVPEYVQLKDNKLFIAGMEYTLDPNCRVFVVGAGKASATMARAVESVLGEHVTNGLVVTKYEHLLPLKKIICQEAAHPVPDEAGLEATKATIKLLQKARPGDIIICLVSGGASALWIDLPYGASLKDVQVVFRLLLHSGAGIEEMNTVRKHLSVVKGGQLIRYASKAHWISLIISDVPGDDLAIIASGPTAPDSSTFDDAMFILAKYGLTEKIPEPIYLHLLKGINGEIDETPKMHDPLFDQVQNLIIGNNSIALEAAKVKAMALGYAVQYFSNTMQGDAAETGRRVMAMAHAYNGPIPACMLFAGETTVEITKTGKGGRNMHLALSVLAEMKDRRITLLAAGTDGTDGPTDAAGAIADLEQVEQSTILKLDAREYLQNQDSYHFFEATGGLLKTGATQTNVMDLVILLIE